MKIDNVIFSTSEEYSKFWNIQSKIYKTALGIEPICILYGNKSNTDMSEEYGTVIEREFIENLPKVLQLTWSKFDYTKTDPEKTWMIGDIDLIPLRKEYFATDDLINIPDDNYAHLNCAALSVVRSKPKGEKDLFLKEGPPVYWRIRDGSRDRGADLPAHYHVAKGKAFIGVYALGRSFERQVRDIVDAGIFGHGGHCEPPWVKPINDEIMGPDSYFWLAEENYSSYMLHDAIQNGRIKFTGVHYCNYGNRVDRSSWSKEKKIYDYDLAELESVLRNHAIVIDLLKSKWIT